MKKDLASHCFYSLCTPLSTSFIFYYNTFGLCGHLNNCTNRNFEEKHCLLHQKTSYFQEAPSANELRVWDDRSTTRISSSSPEKKTAAASRLSPWLCRWRTIGVKALSEVDLGDQRDSVHEALKHGLAYFLHSFTMEGIYVLAFTVRGLRVLI